MRRPVFNREEMLRQVENADCDEETREELRDLAKWLHNKLDSAEKRIRMDAKEIKVRDAVKKQYNACDLDDHVHELKSREATTINNSSMDEQLTYLIESGGLDWVEEVFLKEDT
jgi:hypothetical protein